MINLKILPYVPENDSVSEFYRWKQSRKKIIGILGPKLLLMNETDLITLLDSWEKTAQSNLQSEQPTTILVGLIHLAVFFYFIRSISRINKFITRITQLVLHSNRCICRSSAHILFYLSYHSLENINYLHDFIASNWIVVDPNFEFLYASLVILDEAFFLAPALVRSFVTPNVELIFDYCFVDDFEIQDAALQVVYHHAALSNDADCKTNLFIICYSHLTPKTSSANRGALLIAKMLAKMHLTKDQIDSIILMITTFLNIQDDMVLQLCFEVVFMIFDQCEIKLSSVLMYNLCTSMINCLNRKTDFNTIWSIFVKIMKMTPANIFQTDIILEFAFEIFANHKVKPQFGYALLLLVHQRNPQIQVNSKIPFDQNLCKEYRSLLKVRPLLILEDQKQLQQIVENGIKQTNENQLILSLKVAKACCSMLWGGTQALINRIYPLYSSASELVRLEVVKIIGKFQKQHQLMVSAALFDRSAIVRKTAIGCLFIQENLTRYDLLPNVLNDQSAEVTSNFLDLLNNIYNSNPMLFAPSIFTFYKKLVGGYLRSYSLRDASIASHLFPKFATLILKVDDNLARSFADFCIYVLRRGGSPNPPVLNDLYVNKNILKPFSDSNNIKLTIFRLVHLPLLDTCDINFLKALEILREKADHSQISPLFTEFFKERRKQDVLQTALLTLKSFIQYIELPLDDVLIDLLFDVLNRTSFPSVTAALFKLFGTAGITSLPASIPKASTLYLYTSFIEYTPKFIHDELFVALCHLVPNQLPSFFSAVTHSIIFYPNQAPKYLGTLIPEFIKELSVGKNDSIIHKLIRITKEMQNSMTPYLDLLQPLLLERMGDELCTRFCKVLSFSLKNNFIKYSSSLFLKSLSIVPELSNFKIFKQHMKFLSFSVILQHQPIEDFLKLSEKLVSDPEKPQFVDLVINELIRVIQNCEKAKFSASWFARLFLIVHKNPNSIQLMYSIAKFGNISFYHLNQILDSCGITDQNFQDLQEKFSGSTAIPPFMRTVSVSIKSNNIPRSGFSSNSNNMTNINNNSISTNGKNNINNNINNINNSDRIFSSIVPPLNKNIDKWIQDFVQVVVSNSPSRGIRVCRDLVNQSEQFRNDILPAAFLTCWEVTPDDQRVTFLGILKFILETYRPLPETLWRLLDILDACGISLDLPLSDLARASIFPAQAIHYWKSDFRAPLSKTENTEQYLGQLLNIGQIDAARGVLTVAKNYVNNVEQWSEKLGDWGEALRAYKKNDFVGLIRCYGNLEDWKNILSREDKFTSLTNDEKRQCAVWYGWAFYFAGDIRKAEFFIRFFSEKFDQQQFFLQCLIKIIHNEFDSAQEMIKNAFDIISTDHSMFDGSNVKAAEEKLTFSQHLIELSEVIQTKRANCSSTTNTNTTTTNNNNSLNNNFTNIPKLWGFRQPLQERSFDCRELTNIRSLLLSKEQQLKISLKMATSLRKGRQWNGLKGAYFRLLRIGKTPKVFFEGIKMLWCKNLKSVAITFLSIFVSAYSDTKTDLAKIKDLFQKVPPKALQYVALSDTEDNRKYSSPNDFNVLAEQTISFSRSHPISDKLLAKANRILTNWRLQEEPQTLESLIKHCETLHFCLSKSSEDVKTLFGLALVDMKIIDNDAMDSTSNLNNEYALDAVCNFLKNIQISSDQNLSALLLLLNLLSRFANDYLMNNDNICALKSLPYSLVSKALPQLTNLLSHKCEKLRNAVRDILLNFGKSRFQKLFFSLNVGRLSLNTLKAKNSNEIFEQLRAMYPEVGDELVMFVDNLHSAAISLLEVWKYGIEAAKRSYEKQDFEQMVTILSSLLHRLDNPICDLDRSFKKLVELSLGNFRELFESYISKNNEDNENQDKNNDKDNLCGLLWSRLYNIFEQITRKVNQLATISFLTVAPDLANRRDLHIVVPGTHDTTRIVSFDPTLRVFGTAFHPRFLTMIGENGKETHFLLKGNCDVRIDYRIMQFFLLMNSFLAYSPATTALSITQYSIVPLTKDAGLISWVENSESLHQIIGKFTKNRSAETELIKATFENASATMSRPQLLELFDVVSKQTPADEIDKYIWLKASTSSIWLKNNNTFVNSTALMSIAGYIIGLGDRHPNNILLQNHNGKVAHIDFEDAFEITMNRKVYPEKVPFRLTRMIVNALDGGTPFGMFKRTCEDVLSLLRDSKQAVIAQFELFTMDSTISSNPRFESAKIMQRVREKLEGKDLFMLKEDTITVEKQVSQLISVSSNPELYATQFIGWCPCW